MLKRMNEIKVRLTDYEMCTITKQANDCGYSREAYIRSLLDKRIPRPMPPPDYHAMMRELHYIGNNLNQISQKAHVLNVIDAQRYDVALRQFSDAVASIEAAILLPVKSEW